MSRNLPWFFFFFVLTLPYPAERKWKAVYAGWWNTALKLSPIRCMGKFWQSKLLQITNHHGIGVCWFQPQRKSNAASNYQSMYLNQFITIQFNGASLRNCVKQKTGFPLHVSSIFSARDRTERGIDNAVRRWAPSFFFFFCVSLCISNIFIAIYLLRSIKRVHCPSWGRLINNYRHRLIFFFECLVFQGPPSIMWSIGEETFFRSSPSRWVLLRKPVKPAGEG